jgi:hypothetical protein
MKFVERQKQRDRKSQKKYGKIIKKEVIKMICIEIINLQYKEASIFYNSLDFAHEGEIFSNKVLDISNIVKMTNN